MPAPTVTVQVPQIGARYFDPGLVRPEAIVSWTGGVGPFDVLHEWDDDSGFGSPITDLNASATSPDTGVPPSDMGPAGTDWFYRTTVTDTDDSTFTTSPSRTLTFEDPIDFRRHLYLLANVDTSTPTPHIWYLFPTFGREGWEFKIIGFGFGDTQGQHTGTARLNALAVGIISWSGVAELASTLVIDPGLDIAEPEHQDIRATVPTGGASGLIFVETDDV